MKEKYLVAWNGTKFIIARESNINDKRFVKGEEVKDKEEMRKIIKKLFNEKMIHICYMPEASKKIRKLSHHSHHHRNHIHH